MRQVTQLPLHCTDPVVITYLLSLLQASIPISLYEDMIRISTQWRLGQKVDQPTAPEV